jgi:ribonuclease P protein component
VAKSQISLCQFYTLGIYAWWGKLRSFFFKIMQKKEIIKDNKVFLRLYKRGKYIAGKTVVVYFRKNGTTENRVGITTTKKVGNAVKRNRVRRRLRALAELILPEKGSNACDYVLIGRTATFDRSFDDLKKDLKYALKKI